MIYKGGSRYVCVFGAGQCGKELLYNTYVGGNIACFIDNDKSKQGKNIAGIPIISFNEYLLKKNISTKVILSVDSDDIRQQLMEHNIEWYEIKPGNRGYFNQSDVISKMDEKVLYKFDTDFWLKNSLVCTDYKNWYRTEYYSDENEKLIENMKKGDSEAVQNWLSALYKSVPEKLDDELFINRPGMRLIYNLIKREQNKKLNIVDFGCGHGELIKKCYNNEMNVLGIELSKLRSDYLRAEGIKCINSDLCNTGISDKSHNIAICQEVLEHVTNPLLVMNEINRVLDMDGLLFITVPVGKYCDCSTHVRHFNQDNLYTLIKKSGFDIINMIYIPYVNWNNDNNFFVAAKKVEDII